MTNHRTLFWLLLILTFALGLAALVACDAPFSPAYTPTPTRTPRPTATPTPTLTPTPAPTPTPAWPVTVGCGPAVPAEVCARLQAAVEADPAHFVWADEPAEADVRLDGEALPNAHPVGAWTYALAAPFFTLDDEVALSDLQATWTGAPAGPFIHHPLLVTTDTLGVLLQWGPPTGAAIRVVEPGSLLTEALQLNGWALVPFHELEPRWKVLRVDGLSPLEKGLADYPLSVPIYIGAERRTDAFPFLPADFSNRDESRMAIVAMTGVTALTRGTAQTMEQKGVTYPARDIAPWLLEADLTHISNEVSFTPDCPVPPRLGTMTFCSHERYIELLDAVGTDIVELTGNHNNDYGTGPNLHTLELFRQRGWKWFGGGANLAEAMTPVTVTLGPNRLAFIGCNSVGPSYAYATEDSPGAAPCGDWTWIREKIAALRAEGYLPIVTVQYYETYEYFPTPQQVADFRALAEAGAVVVQGSQAHQPQGFDFHAGAFIHYGLGNLFFDQMQSLGTRQEFIDRLVFYDGRLLSVDLRTAILEEGARPRPMAPPERQTLLEAVFAASPIRRK